jgi:hypothetical protein
MLVFITAVLTVKLIMGSENGNSFLVLFAENDLHILQ